MPMNMDPKHRGEQKRGKRRGANLSLGAVWLAVLGSGLALGQIPPQPISTTPNFGYSASQTFVFTFGGSSSWNNVAVANVLINNSLNGAGACFIAYVPSSSTSGLIYLVNNAGSDAVTMVIPGTGTIANDQCSLSAAGSSASVSGTTVALSLAITFKPAFGGNKIIYMAARDSAENNSGWKTMGTWGVPAAAPPGASVVSLSPASGARLTQSFTFGFSDTLGWQDLTVMNVLINSALDGGNACYLAFLSSGPSSGILYLVNDAGPGPGAGTGLSAGVAIPNGQTVENSQCRVSGQGSMVSSSGTNTTLTVAITFKPSFAGQKLVYLAAGGLAGNTNSFWQAMGTWAVADVSIPIVPTSVYREAASDRLKLITLGSATIWDSGQSVSGTPVSAKNVVGDTYVAALEISGLPKMNVFTNATQTWRGWQAGTGAFTGKPALTIGADGAGKAVYRAVSGNYWLLTYRPGAGFAAQVQLGSQAFSSDPAVVAAPDGSIYVAGTTGGGEGYISRVNPLGVLEGWNYLGSGLSGAPAITAGSDSAAYLIVNKGTSAWMGRYRDLAWSGWFLAAAGSAKPPVIGSSGLGIFAAVVDGLGVPWTCSMPLGNSVCGTWTQRLGVSVQDVSMTVERNDVVLAARDISSRSWWYRLGASQWTQNGVQVAAASMQNASVIPVRGLESMLPTSGACVDDPYYANVISEYGLYAMADTQTWVGGPGATLWTTYLGSLPVTRDSALAVGPSDDTGNVSFTYGSDQKGVIRRRWYPIVPRSPGLYSQTATHSWIGPSGDCSVSPRTTTFSQSLPGAQGPPSISLISPSAARVGDREVAVTISGSNLSAASQNGLQFLRGTAGDVTIAFIANSVTATEIKGTLRVSGKAPVGQRLAYLSTIYGESNKVPFTIQGDPTPVITSITPSIIEADQIAFPITILGSGFGSNPDIAVTGNGAYVRIDSRIASTDSEIHALVDTAPGVVGTVEVSVISFGTLTHNFASSGGSTAQSVSKSLTLVNPQALQSITIEHRSFIRANWVEGPTNCLLGFPLTLPGVGMGLATDLYFRGDSRNFMIDPVRPSDVPAGHPFRSRMVVKISFPPGGVPILTYWGGDAGTCRLYDGGSLVADSPQVFDPAGSMRIVDPTIVDNEPRVCRNDSALVEKALGPGIHVTPVLTIDPGDNSLSFRISGAAPNPLVPINIYNSIAVKWDFIVTIAADRSTVGVTGTHTCYPAHEVVVNRGSTTGGQYLWRYGPSLTRHASQFAPSSPNLEDNSLFTLTSCLVPGIGGLYGYNPIAVNNQVSIF